MTHVLAAHNLTVHYGERPVLDGLELLLNPQEITVVLGENGAGKSTLLRALAGELALSTGTLKIGGTLEIGTHDALQQPELAAQKLIHIAQHPPLAPLLTPREHVQALVAFRQLVDVEARMLTVAEALRLTPVLDRPVRALSGGTMHKVALMLAFLAQTPLILLDEPHAGLDVRSALALRQLIREERDRGTCFLLASHLAEATLAIADRALVLARGQWALQLGKADLAEFQGDARRLEAAVLQAMG